MTKIDFLKNVFMFLISNPQISGGMAGRGDEFNHQCFKKPYKFILGFNWWFWKPSITWNGGLCTKKEVVDINIHWLCFWFSMTSFKWCRTESVLDMNDNEFKKEYGNV